MHYQQVITGLLAGGIISLGVCTGTSEPAIAQNDSAQTETVAVMKNNQPFKVDEICLYEVQDGKIVSEQFFY